MKYIRGIKIGGLQQKIFNLVLIIILVIIATFTAVSVWQQRELSGIVKDASAKQQTSIVSISDQTMQSVMQTSMARTTALQAYIANDLFADVETDVMTLHAVAEELFEHADNFAPHPFYEPDPTKDGIATVQVQHEEGVDPADSEALGLVANMSEVMLAMFENSVKLNSCFVATPDGCILYVDDRSGSYVSENGEIYTFDTRHRPWYLQAAEEGKLIFTGVELDAFTDIPGLVCAAPVYRDGELVAVVGADIFLTAVRDYVEDTAVDGGFLCVLNEHGQVLFSPVQNGIFKAEITENAPDLRACDNAELAAFISQALTERTALSLIKADGKTYYMTGAPMETLGWTVISVVDKELIDQPTKAMLTAYEDINAAALGVFDQGAQRASQMVIVMTILIFLVSFTASLILASRIVKPLERMTKRIGSLGGNDLRFDMEKEYRTGDEIEVLAESFAQLSGKTLQYIEQVEIVTAEKERIGTELALATRIQADMLPNIYPAFPERPEFDIYATMDPAKEVGGDFYDFFLIDDTHLGLVIADVSGKGVPAALFMMVSKILVQNNAMSGLNPAEVLRAVNNQICANNREEMFVTVWFGVLDTVTGVITAASAGHEYPALLQEGGEFRLVKDKHGLVIGAMEGVRFKEYELRMKPGDRLFVYTDGVPEATNAENELFGTDRMLDALNEDPDATPEQILKNARQAVDSFVKDAEQFDDMTMLCLEYKGCHTQKDPDKQLVIPAEVDNLPRVLSYIEKKLEEADCPIKAKMQIAVAAEEVFVNIASYAYAPNTGTATVNVGFTEDPKAVAITFMDSGVAFDPLVREDPDVTLPADAREIGGLGIFMTKKVMDDVRYEYRDGQNILTIIKNI